MFVIFANCIIHCKNFKILFDSLFFIFLCSKFQLKLLIIQHYSDSKVTQIFIENASVGNAFQSD